MKSFKLDGELLSESKKELVSEDIKERAVYEAINYLVHKHSRIMDSQQNRRVISEMIHEYMRGWKINNPFVEKVSKKLYYFVNYKGQSFF